MRYFINGKEISEDELEKRPSKIKEILKSGIMMSPSPAGYPYFSHAASVGFENVAEARQVCQKTGIATEFNSDGEPKFTSRGHRKKFCKEFGLYDRNAGYGDQAPTCKASTDSRKEGIKRKTKNRIKAMGL